MFKLSLSLRPRVSKFPWFGKDLQPPLFRFGKVGLGGQRITREKLIHTYCFLGCSSFKTSNNLSLGFVRIGWEVNELQTYIQVRKLLLP